MPFIEQLLNGENVEWKKLGEVCEIKTAPLKLIRKEYKTNGITPIIDQGENYISGYTNEDKLVVPKGEYVLFGDHSEHIKYVDFSFVQGADGLKILQIKHHITKYVFYAFNNFYKRKNNYKRHWSEAKETIIPLPPLSVQYKIVEILDKFTELEAELDCRKRQYEYYRNQLLSLDILNRGQKLNDVKIMALGEIGTFVRGSGLQKKDLTTQGISAIHYGQIYTYYGTYAKKTKSFVTKEIAEKLKKVNYGDVIITNTSENIEDVCKAVVYLLKEQGVTGGHASIFKPSEKIIGKYLAYYTQTTDFAKEKRKFAKGTKVIDVNAKDLAKIQIPLPPLSVQREIVEILDKFDTLCNSISEGLPKEIELRRKQYEYYRNQLLTFAQ